MFTPGTSEREQRCPSFRHLPVKSAALTIVLWALVEGACSRAHDVEPAQQKPSSQGAKSTSLDVCERVPPKECGEKAALLSNDPATESQAVPMLRAACLQHDARSCHNLGTILALSSNVSLLDGKGALDAYEEGCRLGDLMSCCDAANALELGTVVPRDFARAGKLYGLGCEPDKGMFICCIGLERLYKTGGSGLARDPKRAASYYRRAKRLGYHDDLEDD
jgi:TPR repeat protein